MTLTVRQQQVLDFIEETQRRTGVVPSTREIQAYFGFASQTAAMNHLRALEKHGKLVRQPGKARAMSVVTPLRRERIVDIPLFGHIVAGMAESVEQELDGVVSLDAVTAGIARNSRVFALKVRGDSMIGAHIDEGDLVICEQRRPKDGDIVAALIDGETTLKRYVVQDGRPVLRAENPSYPDLQPERELTIHGVMVALIRRCRT
jgi:repressor LexA